MRAEQEFEKKNAERMGVTEHMTAHNAHVLTRDSWADALIPFASKYGKEEYCTGV